MRAQKALLTQGSIVQPTEQAEVESDPEWDQRTPLAEIMKVGREERLVTQLKWKRRWHRAVKNRNFKDYQPLPRPAGQALPLEITNNELTQKYFSDGEESDPEPELPIGGIYSELFPETFVEAPPSPKTPSSQCDISTDEQIEYYLRDHGLEEYIPKRPKLKEEIKEEPVQMATKEISVVKIEATYRVCGDDIQCLKCLREMHKSNWSKHDQDICEKQPYLFTKENKLYHCRVCLDSYPQRLGLLKHMLSHDSL